MSTAVLLMLQSQIHFTRNADGTWSFEYKKEPTDTALLKDLMQKLLSFL